MRFRAQTNKEKSEKLERGKEGEGEGKCVWLSLDLDLYVVKKSINRGIECWDGMLAI